NHETNGAALVVMNHQDYGFRKRWIGEIPACDKNLADAEIAFAGGLSGRRQAAAQSGDRDREQMQALHVSANLYLKSLFPGRVDRFAHQERRVSALARRELLHA